MKKGNCYICGAELGKGAMKNHILKEHSSEGQACRLLLIEGAYDKDYWLYVDMPVDKTLNALDKFLRNIWLECCGHLSEFQGVNKNSQIGSFSEGSKIRHLYDMGETTETIITVLGTIQRPPQREIIRLLARNEPPQFLCADCGAVATYICTKCRWDKNNPFYCERCASKHEHENMLLPVTNSPRMGMCGYAGELDKFAFVQPKIAAASQGAAHKADRKGARKQPQEKTACLYPDELYSLAFAFRNAKLWDKLYEDEIFAFLLPSGEMAYCSVMGMIGEHFALAVYLGERGLQSFQRIGYMALSVKQFEVPSELEMLEHMLSQLCVQCVFENKSILSSEELVSVRNYAARHDIKFRGRNSFPQFMKYYPATYPERMTSEDDEYILCEALRAALSVHDKLLETGWGEEEKSVLGFSRGLPANRTFPLLTREKNAYTWRIGRLPEAMLQIYPRPILADDILLARLKKVKKQNDPWVCDVVICPLPVQEANDGAVVFPYILLTADKRTGNFIFLEPVFRYERDANLMLRNLAESMLEHGVPSRIIVVNDRTYALLEHFANSLGIALEQAHEDELLDEITYEFTRNFLDEDEDVKELSDEEEAEIVADFLLNMDEAALLQAPQSVWEAFREEINKGFVSKDAQERFFELDKKRRK